MVHNLVPSDRVETAAVYGRDGQKIGTIERLMLEKKTGSVAYAVVEMWRIFQGRYTPLPATVELTEI
jgi:sporulation protein YlmC with PRC-barrel domain